MEIVFSRITQLTRVHDITSISGHRVCQVPDTAPLPRSASLQTFRRRISATFWINSDPLFNRPVDESHRFAEKKTFYTSIGFDVKRDVQVFRDKCGMRS